MENKGLLSPVTNPNDNNLGPEPNVEKNKKKSLLLRKLNFHFSVSDAAVNRYL